MAQTNAADSKNLKVSRSQSVSIENHVNRIRSANSRRLSNILSNTDNINLQEAFDDRRKSHQNSVPTGSLEEFNSKKEKQDLSDTKIITEKRRNSSNVSETVATRKRSSASNVKSSGQTQRELTSINTERLKGDRKEIDFCIENGEVDFEEKSQKEIFTSDTPHSLKDAVVLNWLHGLRCPFLQKEKHDSDISESKRSVVQIYQKPTKMSMKLPRNIKSSGLRNVCKSPIKKEEKSDVSGIGQKSIDSASETLQESERRQSKEITEKVNHVEMQVSELNKMQITINPKMFSADDSAIIIWVDAIPKTYFTPKYSRRLSIFPQSDIALDKVLTGATKNQPESEFAEKPIRKPDDVCYPPITVLKNIALDSEFDLRKISEEDENSVYLAECSLDHIQSKINKELQPFSKAVNEELEE